MTEDVEDTLPESKRARLSEEAEPAVESEAMAVESEDTPTMEANPGEAINADATSDNADAAGDAATPSTGSPAEAVVEDADEPQQITGPTMRISKKLMKGEGGFKENPYTFLSPDDPVLVSCL